MRNAVLGSLMGLFVALGVLLVPTVTESRSRTGSDLGSRVAALEAQNATQAAQIAALQATLVHFTTVGNDIFIDGANLHVRNGLNDTETTNALGNVIIGYQELRISGNDRSGSHMLVVGKENNYSSYGGVVVGDNCETSGLWSAVCGGQFNTASNTAANVSGGLFNLASGPSSAVSGGRSNIASGTRAQVSGGFDNTASGDDSQVSGGDGNMASGSDSQVSGGFTNTASGGGAHVAGGNGNTASGIFASVSGESNVASGRASNVSGGFLNTASGTDSAISGGQGNDTALFSRAQISGGLNQTSTAFDQHLP